MTQPQARANVSLLEALALSYAHDLHRLLGDICDLPQHGRGSCAEAAWNLMDVVIWHLDPNAEGALPARKFAVAAGEPSVREQSEIRLMIEAGVSIADAAAYFGASEAAVRHLIGGNRVPHESSGISG
jgi:hypothetical protein